MAGGGSTLLKLAQKVDSIIATLDNDEQKVGAEIVRRALSYPLKLIANNAGVNGSVVVQKVCPRFMQPKNYNLHHLHAKPEMTRVESFRAELPFPLGKTFFYFMMQSFSETLKF